MTIEHWYSPIDRTWYVGVEGDIARTKSIEGAAVNIDFSPGGEVVGIEIIEPSK